MNHIELMHEEGRKLRLFGGNENLFSIDVENARFLEDWYRVHFEHDENGRAVLFVTIFYLNPTYVLRPDSSVVRRAYDYIPSLASNCSATMLPGFRGIDIIPPVINDNNPVPALSVKVKITLGKVCSVSQPVVQQCAVGSATNYDTISFGRNFRSGNCKLSEVLNEDVVRNNLDWASRIAKARNPGQTCHYIIRSVVLNELEKFLKANNIPTVKYRLDKVEANKSDECAHLTGPARTIFGYAGLANIVAHLEERPFPFDNCAIAPLQSIYDTIRYNREMLLSTSRSSGSSRVR